jgi:hypothetical protein
MGKDYSPPEPSVVDHAHSLIREVAEYLPGVGQPAVKLFEFLFAPPLEKRRQEWMESVAEGLRGLEENQHCKIEDLRSNDAFIDTAIRTSQAALRTSQQEKREALRNAMLNAALPHAPDASRQQIFVGWVESLTVWHLRMLRLFADPPSWFKANKREPQQHVITSSLSGLLTEAYPELKNERPFYDKIAKDLYNDGLLGSDSLHVMMSAGGAHQNHATQLGEQFLRFISDPSA